MKNRLSQKFRQSVSLPLVDFVKKTQMIQTFDELKETQWHKSGELEVIQLEKLRKILIHAYENVPYYTALFKKIDFNPEHFQSFEDLHKIPILTKKKIRENFNSLKARNIQRFYPRKGQTSGSTGEPLKYYRDKLSHSCGWANNWRAFSIIGFDLGDPFMILSGGALMPRATPFKQKIYYKLMGISQLPTYHLSAQDITHYITLLEQIPHPTLIYAYASAVFLLARQIIKQNKHFHNLQAVFTTSEVLSSNQRLTIQEAFGCPVFDTYGNNESNIYAFECSEHKGLHYGMEHAYLEVLNKENQLCSDGQVGRFITTNLANYAMPFIRYDTGDLGSVVTEPCSCGRGLIRINEILGRSRDFISTPSGRHIHGAFFNHFEPFYKTPWITAWHVRQDTLRHITISLCPDGTPLQEDIIKIKDVLNKALGEDLEIDFVIDDKLHTTPAGKQKVIESCLGDNELVQ